MRWTPVTLKTGTREHLSQTRTARHGVARRSSPGTACASVSGAGYTSSSVEIGVADPPCSAVNVPSAPRTTASTVSSTPLTAAERTWLRHFLESPALLVAGPDVRLVAGILAKLDD